MSKKIYLSPSNQYGNLYAYGNTNEMEQCNLIADEAKKALERCGFTVRKAPKGQAMSTSIQESNSWGADLHIPIHTNAGNGNGTVIFVYNKSANNMKLATPIYNAVQAVTPGKVDYGVKEYPDLAELNSTNALSVYIEVDFHDNKDIAKWIIDNPTVIGEAVAKGVCEGYGVEYKTSDNANVKVINKTSYIRSQPYVDDFGGSSVKLATLKVGTALAWLSDDGYGWSKVKYGNITGYIQNSRIDKKNISSWRSATITSIPVYDKPCGSVVKTVAVTSKLTVTSKIVSGKYAGWTCILLDGKDRFVRTACLKLGEKRLK